MLGCTAEVATYLFFFHSLLPESPDKVEAVFAGSSRSWSVALAQTMCALSTEWMRLATSADVVDWTSRINAVGRARQWRRSVHLLRYMMTCSVLPNEITFGVCMSACARASEWKRALHLLQGVKEVALKASVVMYNAALSACEKSSQWAVALQLFSCVPGDHRDLITYNSLITVMGRASHWSRALVFLAEVPRVQLQPDRITLNAAINACSRAACWESALVLVWGMIGTGPVPTIADFNAAISALDEPGQWERAQRLLWDAEASALCPDIVTYTSVMSALGSGKQWGAALGLLHSIVQRSFQPELRTYNVALSALRRARAWQACLDLTATASSAGLHRDIITQNELIRASAQSHQWELAHNLCRSVTDISCQPTRITFNAALQGCEHRAGADRGPQLLDEMRQRRLPPESVDFTPVILGFLAGDRLSGALSVLDSMLESVCGKGLLDVVAYWDEGSVARLRRHRVLSALAACLTQLLSACERAEVGLTCTELALLKLLAFGVDYVESNDEVAGSAGSYDSLLQLLLSLAPVGLAARLAARGRDSQASQLLWDLLEGRKEVEPLSQRVALTLQAELLRRPRVYLPPLPSAGALALPPKRSHARELCLLQYVLTRATPGSPSSVCDAVEAYGSEVLGAEGMWSKFAGGGKADCLVAAVAGSVGDGQVLEIGTYCGYATLRLAQALPRAEITSLESDPTMVAIARTFMALSAVATRVDVRTGRSSALLPSLAPRSFGAVFMDVWGSQYMELCEELNLHGLLLPGATLVADNVLETGAMLYLWHVARPRTGFHTQVMSVAEFTSAGKFGVAEDWLSVSVKRVEAWEGRKEEPPAEVLQAHRACERMRELVFSPGHSVTAKERMAFCAEMKSLISSALPRMEPQIAAAKGANIAVACETVTLGLQAKQLKKSRPETPNPKPQSSDNQHENMKILVNPRDANSTDLFLRMLCHAAKNLAKQLAKEQDLQKMPSLWKQPTATVSAFAGTFCTFALLSCCVRSM